MNKAKKIIIAIILIFIQFIILTNIYCVVNADDELQDSSTADSLDLIKTKQQSFSATSLPVSYDLRSSNPFNLASHGNLRITPEHQVGGTCWDYATMMALQTCLAMKSNSSTYPLLSKPHLDYLASKYSGKTYGTGRELAKGAWFSACINYFKNNDGPILSSKCNYTLYNGEQTNERVTLLGVDYYNNTDDKKRNICNKMDAIEPDYYVHEITEFPKILVKAVTKNGVRTKEAHYKDTGDIVTDSEFREMRNLVKKHIMNNGGVWCDIRTHTNFIGDNLGDTNYTSRYSQYDDGTVPNEQTGQHAITVIGWDDNYSRDNFRVKDVNGNWVKPIQNGAWLTVNNVEESEAQGGCQWFSYEDYAINAEMFGFVSADATKKTYNYKFTSQKAYDKLKGLCTEYGNGVTCSDNTKTINGLDLIFNDFKALNFNSCELSNSDLNTLFTYKLARLTEFKASSNNISNITALNKNKDTLEYVKLQFNKIKDVSVFGSMTNLKSLDLYGNQISDVSSLKLNQYDYIDLRHQNINVELETTNGIYSYPSIFTEAKKSTSKLYSDEGFSFSGCVEKSDKTGIILTSNNATVTIESGNAAGTKLTITANEMIKVGDIDGNWDINIRDIIKLRKYIANSTKWNLAEVQKVRADTNRDGSINIRDIIRLRKYIAANSNKNIASKHPDWLW